MYSCVGEVALRYNNGNGSESAAVLVSRNSTQDVGAMNNTYANTDDVVPVFYEVPVSGNQYQYEAVVEHRTEGPVTENPNVEYEGVGPGAISTASSLVYGYVPSKVSLYRKALLPNDDSKYNALCHQLSGNILCLCVLCTCCLLHLQKSRQQGMKPGDSQDNSTIYGELESMVSQ